MDDKLTALYELGQRLVLLRDSEGIAEAVLEIAARVLDCQDSNFFLVDEGRGELYMVARRGQLEAGEHIELRFTDTGPGIPEEFRDRIFEPFFTYGKREGAGLGLAIARRIVEEHGGELWVESGEERGATFVVALPA